MGESISHKETHTKKSSDTNNKIESNKIEKVSELTNNGENSDKSTEGGKSQTPKEDEHKGKSGDGMNDQLFNKILRM